MGSGLFGCSTAGGEAVGGGALGAVWADSGLAVASRPAVISKAQRNMECLCCCGIETGIGSPDGAGLDNRNVPEPKIERKYFVIRSRHLS